MAASDPVVIEQILPHGGIGVRIELDGPSLPQAGLAAPRMHREVKWRPPGATRPGSQSMGEDFGDLEPRGDWDDAVLGENETAILVSQFNQIVRDGYRVSLTWGDTLKRTGLITKFTPEWHKPGECRWSFTMSTHEAEGQTNKIPGQRTASTPGLAAIAAKFSAQAEAAAAYQSAVLASSLGALIAGSIDPDSQFTVAGFVVRVLASTTSACALASVATTPQEVADVALIANTGLAYIRFGREDVGRIVFDFQDGADQIAAQSWRSKTFDALDHVVTPCFVAMRATCEALTLGGTSRRTHIVSAGETLQSIARDELNDWTAWTRLVDLNGLAPGTLPAIGVELVLPGDTRTVGGPLTKHDLDLPLPGDSGPARVGPTGDLVTFTGEDSLASWMIHAAVAAPGSLLHRPAFGAGMKRGLAGSIAGRMSSIKAALERAFRADPRVLDSTVTAVVDRASPDRLIVTAVAQTIDDGRVTVEQGIRL